MKYLSVTFSRLPCFVATEPSKWSCQTLMENVIRRTRSFLRSFGRSKTNILRLPPQPPCTRLSSSLKKRPYFAYFRSGFLRRATFKWNSNSLAAALHRGTSKALFRGGCGPALGIMGFALANKPSLLTEQDELEGLAYEIREAFSKLPWGTTCSQNEGEEQVPDMHKVSVNDLEFGDLLAKGCNAAVYSARWKYEENLPQVPKPFTNEETIISHSEIETHSRKSGLNCRKNNFDSLQMTKELSQYSLAVKLMFNYSAESDAFAIFRVMYKEMLPAYRQSFPSFNNLSLKARSAIPPHPNIVEMYMAFPDQMPLLAQATSSYPQALPTRLLQEGCGRNMTLFLVMKRYHCNLKEYLKNYEPSTQTRLLVLCQLLEGLVHLSQNHLAHRDLKTDNILVDLSHGVSCPLLAITDFGNCLENLQLPYSTEEIDRGGNVALMAPEVATAEAGPFTYIDYSRSDLWTLGTIAYEIFGVANPFYGSQHMNLQSGTYHEKQLPELPEKVPVVIRKLISDMLRRDPKRRPSPTFAATVCQLILHAPDNLFNKPLNKKNYQKIAKWLFLTSAETFLQAGSEKSKSLSVQIQLRLTLCRRIFFSELLKALQYITQAIHY